MSDIIKAAEAKAAEIIAKAKRESAIVEMLPATLPRLPMIVLQTDMAWLSFNKCESLSEILTIYDAFEPVTALDCKGTYRRITHDAAFNEKDHGTILSDYSGWIDIDARCHAYISGAQSATVCFFVRLSNGDVAQARIQLDGNYWNKAGLPMCFHVPFRKIEKSYKHYEWTYERPSVSHHCDDYATFGTGAPSPGIAHHGRAMFSDIRAFIETLI